MTDTQPPPRYDDLPDTQDAMTDNIEREAFDMTIANIKKSTRKQIEEMKKNYEIYIEEMKKYYETRIEEMKKYYENQNFITSEMRDFIVPYLVDARKSLNKNSIELLQTYNMEQIKYNKIEKEYYMKIAEHEKLIKERDFFIEQYKKEISFVTDKMDTQRNQINSLQNELSSIESNMEETMKEEDCWEKVMKIEECKIKKLNINDDIKEKKLEIEKLEQLLITMTDNIDIIKTFTDSMEYKQISKEVEKNINDEIEIEKNINAEITRIEQINLNFALSKNKRRRDTLIAKKQELEKNLKDSKDKKYRSMCMQSFLIENKIFDKIYDIENEITNHSYHDKNLKERLIILEQEKNRSFEKAVMIENILKHLK